MLLKLNFCLDFEHKVRSRFWSWSSGKIFKLEFGQYFAADEVMKLSLGRVSEARFGQNFEFTRPKPAYGRQGLDWIFGPGYSFVVFLTNRGI